MFIKLVIVYAITAPSNTGSSVPSYYMALLPFGLEAHPTQKTPDPEDGTPYTYAYEHTHTHAQVLGALAVLPEDQV